MSETNFEKLGDVLEEWTRSVPTESDDVVIDAQDALIEAGMVQYKEAGWDFKLHEANPAAPKAQFKLMIREADGVDTSPAYYHRFVLPSVLQAINDGRLEDVRYVLGYPNAGTPIAAAFVHLANIHIGLDLRQITQNKINNPDGTRELGEINKQDTEGELVQEGALTEAIDDTATGGQTKVEGWRKISASNLSYSGLSLIVERDPLGSELVRQLTGARVSASMHWLGVVGRAATVLDLPKDAVQREMDYALRLFEWNVANKKTANLPDPDLIIAS